MPRRVFITAAEVSGDQHAAHLIESLRRLEPSVIIEGHGGPEMESRGAVIHHETTRRAAMTYKAFVRVAEMWRLFRWTGKYFDRNPADLQICVDSPAMNFHFARLAHQRGIPVLYYIAPQLWAWREGRIKKLRKWVDQVACILPFEETWFQSRGVNAKFVGHPLFDQLPPVRGQTPGPRFPERPPVIGLLPGSRRSEAVANFPHLLEIAERIRHDFPQARFLVPATPGTAPVVEALAKGVPALEHAQGEFDTMVRQCDLCLTVSGTATLHVASYGVPMIIVYRLNPILWNLVGRWLVRTRTFALVNLLGDGRQHIVPEFVPWYGSNRPVAELALDFLHHPLKLQQQQDKLRNLVSSLDRSGASMNVARLAVEIMDKRQAGSAHIGAAGPASIA
jgi:lipid-A-disaccharide synthase